MSEPIQSLTCSIMDYISFETTLLSTLNHTRCTHEDEPSDIEEVDFSEAYLVLHCNETRKELAASAAASLLNRAAASYGADPVFFLESDSDLLPSFLEMVNCLTTAAAKEWQIKEYGISR
ncbi:MAG: hypothetical protein ACI3V2_10915 [Faecousia sp.]